MNWNESKIILSCMRIEMNFAWPKEYWDIYDPFCVVKDIRVNNSMEIVQGFNLNYPDAT